MAYQVATGVEMLQILTLLESMRLEGLPWIALSLHHDGFTFLGRLEDLEECRSKLEAAARSKLAGFSTLGLEVKQYTEENSFD